MKSFICLIFSLLFSSAIWADVSLDPLLNKVTLQLQTEQWVTTKTALVDVGVNAALTDQGIEQIQAEVMQKLSELSNQGQWHIVSFNRQQDNSGLENVQIMAQARLPQADLANLRNKAKTISKPGVKFTIDNIQFTPSDDEIRQANIVLRNNLYQQAKAEVDALNKVYPDQKYYLHQIDFVMNPPPVQPMPMMEANMSMAKMAAPRPPLSVGNKVQLQATVVIAAMPDAILKSLSNGTVSH